MSNMLYSCSVLYKSRLPMVCVFNKIDAVACEFALEWMTDFEAYLEALDNSSSGGNSMLLPKNQIRQMSDSISHWYV